MFRKPVKRRALKLAEKLAAKLSDEKLLPKKRVTSSPVNNLARQLQDQFDISASDARDVAAKALRVERGKRV